MAEVLVALGILAASLVIGLAGACAFLVFVFDKAGR